LYPRKLFKFEWFPSILKFAQLYSARLHGVVAEVSKTTGIGEQEWPAESFGKGENGMDNKVSSARIACAVLSVALLGCEAPLVLDRVEDQASRPTQRSDLLQAVAVSGDTLIAVGSRGAVIVSNDDGGSWRRQELEGKPFLLAATTCPDGSFVLLDYDKKLWFSDAAASEWQSRPIETYETVQALTCDPAGNLWVTGSFSTVLNSTDGGVTWTESSLDEDLHFTSIQFIDTDTAIMTGEFGVVVRSTDGGGTWDYLEPLPDEFYPQDAYFISADVGWVVGLAGTVMVTTDGGASWIRQDTGTTAPLYHLAKNGGKLYAVGGNGTILKSTIAADGLGNDPWLAVEHGVAIRFYLRGAVPVGDTHLLVTGGAGALFVIPTGA
jgi:photosystem II stability/assembly factor-like uncharacterized protein